MFKTLLFLFLFCPTFSTAIDLNFRFEDNYCQKNRAAGFNPNFVGECGNLGGSRVINQTYENKSFKGAILNSTYVYMSRFTSVDLSHTSFQRAILLQSNFRDSNADTLDLRGSHVKGVTWKKVSLRDLLASGARFTRTQFLDCDLRSASFWGANLQETDFSGSDLRGANLKSTFLLFTRFEGAKFDDTTQLPFSEKEALEKGMIKVD